MPTDRAKKTSGAKSTTTEKAVQAKSKAVPTTKAPASPAEQPERQSQFATILIGLLIIASGLLIYNYFQSINQPSTTTSEQSKQQQQTKTQTSPTPTPTPAFTQNGQQPTATEGKYTVVAGDSLWSVAEKVYGDGHEWDKIAQANTLQKDSTGRPVIEIGQVLTVPDSAAAINNGAVAVNVTPTPTPTVAGSSVDNDHLSQTPSTAITIYTVKHGDSLWSIAEQTYGNGGEWKRIFDDPHNQLGVLPNGRPLIHAGNQLYLPDSP